MSKWETTRTKNQSETGQSLDFEATVSWTDDLEEKLPDNIVFPKELNLFLRNRIQDLTAENGCLRRALEESEEKLRKKQPEATASTPIFGKPNEMATAKIIELSKRCREQAAEIEVLKSKCKTVETNLSNKEVELENERRNQKRSKTDSSQESTENGRPKESEDRIRQLNEKLQQTQTKLYESKNTCVSLKSEINKLNKLLCSEVGENVSLANLSNQPGGWRGRAEQIQLLQQKVAELQSKLSDYEGGHCQKTSTGIENLLTRVDKNEKRSDNDQRFSSASVDRKCFASFRSIEKERRQQIENSAKQLRQSEIAIEGYKRKLEASKARIKVLEHELNAAKGSIAVLNEKRSHDDQLIETLGERLKTMEARQQERETDMKIKEEKIGRECMNLRNDLQSAQLQIERLRRKLEEREIEIDKLRDGIVPNGSIKTQRRSSEGVQSEIYLNSLNHSPPQSFRSSGDPNEYVTLALAAESERERLLELVAVLNRRLDKERNDAEILSNSLRDERHKSAKLELKLRRLETERAGLVRIDTGYRSRLLSRSLKTNDEFVNTEEMRLKMELLQEECLALKARLDTVQQDKMSDFARYKETLDQVRKVFQAAWRERLPITGGTRSTITI
ncbi:coiled-coil domain-containing protein 13 [Halictus rubicundus]|uniref:coiled-coil domain-containing protein 13 n=1 Tax=Halictus rubicundus TaxID=77578 RepID=UPI004036BC88